MINPKNRILRGFKTALDGITYNSNPVPVYSFPAKGAPNFYIQLGDITTVEEGCKDLFGHECTIDIQVIAQYDGNYGSTKDGEAISDIVTNRLKQLVTSVISIPDFDMVYIVLDNGFNDKGLFETNRSYRTINQYRFYLEEITGAPWILAEGQWNDNGTWQDDQFWLDQPLLT